jgi:hypothetical protein
MDQLSIDNIKKISADFARRYKIIPKEINDGYAVHNGADFFTDNGRCDTPFKGSQ